MNTNRRGFFGTCAAAMAWMAGSKAAKALPPAGPEWSLPEINDAVIKPYGLVIKGDWKCRGFEASHLGDNRWEVRVTYSVESK